MRRSSAFLESAECLSCFFRLGVTRSKEITLVTKASAVGVSSYAGRASGLNALLYAIVERKGSRFQSAGAGSLLLVDFAGRRTMKLKAHFWLLKGKSLRAPGLWFLAWYEAVRSTRVGELFRKGSRRANNGYSSKKVDHHSSPTRMICRVVRSARMHIGDSSSDQKGACEGDHRSRVHTNIGGAA
jgi:hypothetical protein